MVLSAPYIELYEKLNRSAFGLLDVQKALSSTYGSTKVIISRLRKQNQIYPVGRGTYVLMSPENYLKLHRLKDKNEKLYELAIAIYRRFPELKMIAFYGSQVTGVVDELSDYDVLLILPGRLSKITKKREVATRLEAELRIKLHLTIYSEEAYKTVLMTEPYIRFWLNEAVFFDEAGISAKPKPSIAKIGYLENLLTAKNYIEISYKEKNLRKKASYCYASLEILMILESCLNLSYEFGEVKAGLEELLGNKLVSAIRTKSAVKKEEIKKLSEITNDKYVEIEKKIETLGENESDIYWKKMAGTT